MPDRTLNLEQGNRNRMPINPASTSLLARLKSLSNVGGAPSQRSLDVMTGDDIYEPTEGELIQQQLAPVEHGGGTYETENGYTGSLSRDMLRESGVAQFKRKLKTLNDQYVAPAQIRAQGDAYTQQLKNSGDIETEQVKGENAARTAAVPRTVNQNITTGQAGGGTGTDASSQFSAERKQRAIDQVNYLLPKVSAMSSGLFGSALRHVPGTAARELQSELESLRSNIGFNELNEMRAASKTGGALGQVSDTENRLLSQALGGLDQANDPATVKKQLQRIAERLQHWEILKRQNAQGGVYQNNGLGLQFSVGGGYGSEESDPYGLFGG